MVLRLLSEQHFDRLSPGVTMTMMTTTTISMLTAKTTKGLMVTATVPLLWLDHSPR